MNKSQTRVSSKKKKKMKKIFFGGLFLIIISQTLIGCKKQKIGTNEISSLRKSFSVENEMLVFKTVEEFDDLISRSNDSIIKEIMTNHLSLIGKQLTTIR